MRPIGSIDIGQVGNKTDSGTERIVHICVFNLTYVVCVYIYVCDAVPLSFILFFSFFVVLYLLFERSYSKYKKKEVIYIHMYSSSQEDDAQSLDRMEQSDSNMTSTSDDYYQWTSTFDRLFSSYQRYNELRRKDDAIK